MVLKQDLKENKVYKLTQKQKRYLPIKRGMDLILSGAAILALSPILCMVALAIKIDSPGPILFRQKRVGKDKELFAIWKFRTMRTDTPKDMPTHLLNNPDAFITKTGKFLRKTSLDELPQIFNILRGQMSIIGPRPALWNQYDLIAERDKYGANDITPGLTGWAQINGRDELEIPYKAKLDGEYVKNLSFKFDCKCFFGTIMSVLKHDGVVEGGTGEMKKNDDASLKKIAVISSHTPSLFWFRINMMQDFISKGYKVIALGQESEQEWAEKFSEKGIEYRQIYVERNGMNPIHDIKTFKVLKEFMQREKPDKIFCYQAKTIIYTCLAAKMSHITEIYPLIAGLGSIFRGESLKSKLVKFVMITEYKLALKNSKAVMFQNNDDLLDFVHAKIVKQDKCRIINGSGVDIENFTVSDIPKVPSFLMIARLIKDKGILEYLEACERIKEMNPNVRCLLIGPYDTNPSALKPDELQKYIDSGTIEYFGEQDDVRPFIEQSSVFVLPSYYEGTPKTVLESMACGRAVITTDAPGCRETVENGVNGFLIPLRNSDAIVEKMKKFIDEPELSKQMGIKGRKIAEDKYDVKKVNKSIIKIMGL